MKFEITKWDAIAFLIGAILAILVIRYGISVIQPHECGCLPVDIAANGTCMKITCI